MAKTPFKHPWLLCAAVPAMVLTAWAVDGIRTLKPAQIDQMEARFALEESKLDLEMMELQLQLAEGTLTPAQYQQAMLQWANQQSGRIKAQNDLAGVLDSLRPWPAAAEPDRGPPSSAEEAELLQVEQAVEKALSSIRATCATNLEAQEKIHEWGRTAEGARLRQRQEDLQNAVAASHSEGIVSFTLEEPIKASPAQRRVLDLQEEVIGKWLAIKAEVMAAGGDVLKLQERVAQEEQFFAPRRDALEACVRDVLRESLRDRVAELRRRTQ